MNQYCYRIIFNKVRGQLMVVADIARTCTQAAGQTRAKNGSRLWATVRHSAWALWLALAANSSWANQIVADPNAAAGLRPEVIQTHNGITQVNIQAPNAAGISHNHYQQFNVGKTGAILNNSAVTVDTQLAGFIQGNTNFKPNTAPARVILNEINSNNPSQLRGFIEVAGGRAQVIIANPSGITCDGCGTINAGRMTLTTGRPQINADGSLGGYRVEQGVIRIEGGGLNGDARHDTEYADLMARAIEVNAGLWSTEGLNLIAGQNQISADGQSITPLATAAGGDNTPEFAIDMAHMGGMYSGHIRMVGTEAGLGVRNSGGHINAGKTLTVTSEGRLEWRTTTSDEGKNHAPHTQAAGDITLAARDDITHAGKLHAGGNLKVDSRKGSMNQSGTLAAQGAVTLSTASDMTLNGHVLAGSDRDSQLTKKADLTLTSQRGQIRADGTLLTQGKATLMATQLNLDKARLKAQDATLTATQSDINLKQAHIDTGSLILSSLGALNTQGVNLRAGQWQVTADSLFNQGGIWSQTGAGNSRFTLTQGMNNQHGAIEAWGLALTAGTLNNTQGRLVTLGNSQQSWKVNGLLTNTGGMLGSNSALALTADILDNKTGTLQSAGDMNLAITQQADNQQGKLLAGGHLALAAQQFTNREQGVIQSEKALNITLTGLLDNQTGTIISQQQANLQVAEVNNQQGTLLIGGDLSLRTDGDIHNQSGKITAQQHLFIQGWQQQHSGTLHNQGGKLMAGQGLTVQATGLDNRHSGLIQSAQALSLALTQYLHNQQGNIGSGANLNINTTHLDNQQGNLHSGGALALNQLQSFNNRQGNLLALGAIRINTDMIDGYTPPYTLTLHNQGGNIQAGDNLQLMAQSLINDGGTLLSKGDMTLNLQQDYTHRQGDKLNSNGRLTLTTSGTFTNEADWILSDGLNLTSAHFNNLAALVSGDTLKITTGNLTNRSRLEAIQLNITSDQLDNQQTIMADTLTVNSRLVKNDGKSALMAATDQLTLTVTEQLLNRDNALIYSGGNLALTSGDLIENRASNIEAEGDITINSKRFHNLREGLMIEREAQTSNYKWHRYHYYWRSFGSGINTNKNSLAPTTQTLAFRDDAAAKSKYGTIINVDPANKRAQVRLINAANQVTEIWVHYQAIKENADGSYQMSFYETLGHRQNRVANPYQNTVWREHNRGRVEQWNPDTHVSAFDLDNISDYNNFRERTATGTITTDKLTSAGTAAKLMAGGKMTITIQDLLLNDASTITANGDLLINGATNGQGEGRVINRGYSVNQRVQEHTVDHYDRNTVHWYPTHFTDKTTALQTIDGVITGNQNVTINTQSLENTTVEQAQISVTEAAELASQLQQAEWANNLQTDTAAIPDGQLALIQNQTVDSLALVIPDNALFRPDYDPNSPFLIVTDSRFKDRNQFISSNYLLERLGYDPAKVQKRLGDGYYEQRSVREQLLMLTGRPSTQGQSAMEQYTALMNNGIQVSQTFNLVPGVALTPAQIAALQQDIVWLVSETVNTANGPQTVLVPKVYLANKTLTVTNDGAVIAGKNLSLSTQSITNAANMHADNALVIQATDFNHLGGNLNADSININAATLNITTNLQDANRQASLTGNSINLSGTDITLQGASLTAQNSLALNAQNNLTIGTAQGQWQGAVDLIAGHMGNRDGNLTSVGGSGVAHLSGTWQNALGSSLQSGGSLSLTAGQDIVLQGSTAQAQGQTTVQAGGNVSILTDKTTHQTTLTANSSSSQVTNHRNEEQLHASLLSGGTGLTVTAGQAIQVEGSTLSSDKGSIALTGQQVTLGAAHSQIADNDHEKNRTGNSKSQRQVDRTNSTAQGSSVTAGKDISITATATDINVQGSEILSEKGTIDLDANRDITITASQNTSDFELHGTSSSSGWLSSSKSEHYIKENSTTANGSTLSGNNINITAGNNLAVEGSQVVGSQDVTLTAGNDLNITTVTETHSKTEWEKHEKSGLMSTGGIGVFIGSQSQATTGINTSKTEAGSLLGSTNGNLTLTAGNQLNVHGSDLIAGKDMALSGSEVAITASENQSQQTQKFEFEQSGLTLALSGAVGGTLNSAVQTANAAKEEKDGRIQSLMATQSILTGVQAWQAGKLESLGDKGKGKEGDLMNTIGVSLSIGNQSSVSETQNTQNWSQGSSLVAGNNLSVTATGDKGKGNLLSQGSQLQAGGNVSLNAANNLDLQSAQNTTTLTGSNSSKGGSIGMDVNFGSGGLVGGISVSGNAGKGKQQGNTLTHTETTVSAGNHVTLTSGKDTTLHGAQVSGNQVTANVGGNLTLQSEQDIDNYHSQQHSGSANLGISTSIVNGSLNLSQQQMDSTFASVQEQTGIFAGEGGFNINVGEHTQLNGAVIASTADKDKNSLTTGTLGFENIDNHAEFSVESNSVGISTGGGSIGGQFLGNAANSLLVNANNSDEASNTTQSAISEGTITITDQDKQKQDINDLSRDPDSAHTALQTIFDKEKEQSKLQQQQLIGQIGSQLSDIISTHGKINATAEANKKVEKLTPSEREQIRDKLGKLGKPGPVTDAMVNEHVFNTTFNQAMSQFGVGSTLQQAAQAATAALQGLVAGDIGKVIAGGTAPFLATIIKDKTEGNAVANNMAHAALGAVLSHLQGNSALAGGAAALTAELAAPLIQQALFGDKKPHEITEEDKQSISALATVAAGLAGGIVGNTTSDAVSGAIVGQNAVENNFLLQLVTPPPPVAGQTVQTEANANIAKQLDAVVDKFGKAVVEGCLSGGACPIGAQAALLTIIATMQDKNQTHTGGDQITGSLGTNTGGNQLVDKLPTDTGNNQITDGLSTNTGGNQIADQIETHTGNNTTLPDLPNHLTSDKYEPNKGSVGNMGEFFNKPGFGNQAKENSQKTSKTYQGQTVYKASGNVNQNIKKGDQFYLDAQHKNHIEVFDSRGKFKHVINLDGSINQAKTKAGQGRKLK